MHNIKLTISYDGTNYSGWQIQPNGVTIHGLIQAAIRKMTGEENNLVGSGRTDAGVHAFAQVASFRTEKKIPPDGFRRGVNSLLPFDIRITDAEEADINFHPIRDAKSKEYHYLMSSEKREHPLCLNRAWCLGRELDIDAMNKAAAYLVGEHDFSAFKASDGCEESSVREVYRVVMIKTQLPKFCHSCEGRNPELLIELDPRSPIVVGDKFRGDDRGDNHFCNSPSKNLANSDNCSKIQKCFFRRLDG